MTIGSSRLVFRRSSEGCLNRAAYTGDSRIGVEIRALVEHHLSDRPGDWHVSIVGFRESDGWEMKVLPNGFERTCTLVGSAGEHQPLMVGACS